MADKDFSLSVNDFPILEGRRKAEDPDRIPNLKAATYKQLKSVNVIIDYAFCSLLSTSRLAVLDPSGCQTFKEVKVTYANFKTFMQNIDVEG